MEREKSNILSHRPESIIFMFLIGLVSVLLNFTFSQNSFAEYKATLSASVNEDTAAINGTEVIESSDETAEHNINLKVKTTNKTGYTVTLSAKTDETALLNTNPAITTKISSISSVSSLSNLPANTWGYSFNTNADFNPIPALSAPVNLIKTTEKSTAEENHNIKLGMKLNSSLKPGNYENKLIISVVSNPYTPKAVMTEGPDFNSKLRSLETTTDKIEHFKKSTVAPAASMNAVNIDDEDSDCEIKLWLDPTDKTAYYYTEPEKVYLNEDSSGMFGRSEYGDRIKNIIDIDTSNFDTSNVTSMLGMFSGMSNLTSLDLSNFNTENVETMQEMFFLASHLNALNLSSFNTQKVRNMLNMFYRVSSLTSLNLSNFDTSRVMNMGGMFSNMSSLTSLDLSNFNTSNATSMNTMFYGMSSLTSLNLSNFDTSKVVSMDFMFSRMSSLTSLNLSNFNTSNVTNMGYMFSDMSSLTSLDLSNFNTSKVTNMDSMFASIYNLTTLNLSNFDTSKVTNMYGMFSNMSSLTSLNLSNFNTSNVTNMGYMFSDMSSLTSLDLSNFNTSKVIDMRCIFSGNVSSSSDKLEKIYVNNDFNTSQLTGFSNMFRNRRKLRGGAGSFLADPSTADKTWLRIDDPANGRPGYFTRKP